MWAGLFLHFISGYIVVFLYRNFVFIIISYTRIHLKIKIIELRYKQSLVGKALHFDTYTKIKTIGILKHRKRGTRGGRKRKLSKHVVILYNGPVRLFLHISLIALCNITCRIQQ